MFGSFYTVGGILKDGVPRLSAPHLEAVPFRPGPAFRRAWSPRSPLTSTLIGFKPHHAVFNFRRGSSNAASNAGPAAQPESVEVMRKRAKHRLIGSAVLVLIGVVGFPLLFDTQPRPIPVDIPIEIPGKGTVKPLAVPAAPAATAPAPAATRNARPRAR